MPNGENEQNKSSSVEAKASDRQMIVNEEVEHDDDLDEELKPAKTSTDLKQDLEEA